MIKLNIFSLCILLMFLLAISACNKIDNYDDCILDSVKNNKTQVAVVYARDACLSKFPTPKRATVQLTHEEISKIKKSGQVQNGHLYGNLYHSNKGLVITEILVVVGPALDEWELDGAQTDPKIKEKRLEKTVAYLVKKDFEAFTEHSFSIDADHLREGNIIWGIRSANGIVTPE